MIFGRTTPGAGTWEMAANTKLAARFRTYDSGNVAKVSLYLDGLGSGQGNQVARVTLYDEFDAQLAMSDEVLVLDGQAPGWVDFPFSASKGKLALAAPGDYFVALHAGDNENTIRVYADTTAETAGGKWNNDTYSDGSGDPFGAATTLTTDFGAFVTCFKPYVSPTETDLYLARLPLAESQEIFAQGGRIMAHPIALGWHSTFLDDETGANALVRDNSDMFHLLGERIRITTYGVVVPKVVYAYVHGVMAEDETEDLSVTRLLFSRLAPLAADHTDVIVEMVM